MVRISCIAVLVAILGVACSTPTDHHHKGSYKAAPKPYSFSYGVEDKHYGPNFMQNEKSDGKNVKGSYSVQLPDGRIQTVKYTADHHNGFFADISYKGKAQYPGKSEHPPFIVKPSHHHNDGGYH